VKAIKFELEASFGWHIRHPATYRVERTYPIIPPTIIFGIVQNILFTSSHKTPYKEIIALGSFPKSDVGLSLEMERIVKIKNMKKKEIVSDRHQIEVAHSDKIECFILLKEGNKSNEIMEKLKNSEGEIVPLTTPQFPAIIKRVLECDFQEDGNSKKLLFTLSQDGLIDGMPYVLPLRYEFKEKEDYRTQKYFRVILPFKILSTKHSDRILERTKIVLQNEIETIKIDDKYFDKNLIEYCENKWDKKIKEEVGTI